MTPDELNAVAPLRPTTKYRVTVAPYTDSRQQVRFDGFFEGIHQDDEGRVSMTFRVPQPIEPFNETVEIARALVVAIEPAVLDH